MLTSRFRLTRCSMKKFFIIIVLVYGAFLAHVLIAAPKKQELVGIETLQCGDVFMMDGSKWMMCDPLLTGDNERIDKIMLAGEEADGDVADGWIVRRWCVCLTDGPWAKKGNIRPLLQYGQVEKVR